MQPFLFKIFALAFIIPAISYSTSTQSQTAELEQGDTSKSLAEENINHLSISPNNQFYSYDGKNQNNDQFTPTNTNEFLDTKHIYTDSTGAKLSIENSLPRGGLTYIAPNGQEFRYAVFWTRITNGTNKPFNLSIEFLEDSFNLTTSPNRYFKLYLPSDSMTPNQEKLFNYGLDLEQYLNANYFLKAPLNKVIPSKSNYTFHVISLFNTWVEGTVRQGFSLNQNKLSYRVNDKIIECGELNQLN